MIHAIRCDQPQFKDIKFEPGFNVILADRTNESTKRDSRNGLGKTTLIEIIHFCLGSRVIRGKGLLQKPLEDWTFSLDIEIKGLRYVVYRNTIEHTRVIVEGDYSDWLIKPEIDPKNREASLKMDDWRKILGWLMFDLLIEGDTEKYSPTFRSLISYYVRKGFDAFSSPFEHSRRQREFDKQVHNAFLLGLGWQYAQHAQLIKDRENELKQTSKALATQLMSNILGSIGKLESEKIRLAEEVNRAKTQLDSFKVHPQYQEIKNTADSLTRKIHDLTNEIVERQATVSFYENSLKAEHPASHKHIAQMYEEANVILPKNVMKRLEDVYEFHRHIIANRQAFLDDEIKRLKREIVEIEAQIGQFSDERAELMSILQTHGALDEYNKLQQRHLNAALKLKEIESRIENLQKLERERRELKIRREDLVIEALKDHNERRSTWQKAVSLFNSNSNALYHVPGGLIIDFDSIGFRFGVEIERADSQGIQHMKVFCYDLMIMQLWAGKDNFPDSLIHDSTIFDGVDERQVANALQLAARESERLGFQYICCLNSDLIPSEDLDEGFKLENYTRLKLTDRTEDGGLLGIRF